MRKEEVESLVTRVSPEDFTRFLAVAGEAACGCREALTFFLRLADLVPWSDEPIFVVLARGAKFQGGVKKAKKKRGTISEEMFADLIRFSSRIEGGKYVGAEIVQMGVGLRISELIHLEDGDWIPGKSCEGGEGELWTGGSPKGDSARHPLADRDKWKTVVCPLAAAELSQCQRAASLARSNLGKKWLFPPDVWKEREFRTHMKRAAVELGWNPKLKWDGTHVLRHGGVARLMLRGEREGWSESLMKRRTRMSKSMRKWYCRSLSARLRR